MTTEQKPAKHEPDWAAIDALTDDDIDRQIAANPDAAPDMGDVPLEQWTAYQPLDVKAIRKRSGMTQEEFAKTYELSLGALRDWEQQRRLPHGPARVLLRVIDREPEAVSRALRCAASGEISEMQLMLLEQIEQNTQPPQQREAPRQEQPPRGAGRQRPSKSAA